MSSVGQHSQASINRDGTGHLINVHSNRILAGGNNFQTTSSQSHQGLNTYNPPVNINIGASNQKMRMSLYGAGGP